MAGFPCFLEFRFQDPQEAREICVCCLQELIQYKDQGLSRPGDEKECRRACRKLLHPEKETMWERENLAIAKSFVAQKNAAGVTENPVPPPPAGGLAVQRKVRIRWWRACVYNI